MGRGLAGSWLGVGRGCFLLPKSLGLTHSVRGRLHPPGGLPGLPVEGPGGPALSNAGQGGHGRAGEPLQGRACVPVFKAGAQAWTGSPAGRGRYGWGLGGVVGGCVTAQGPQASCRETTSQPVPAGGALGPAAVNRGHLPANVTEQ